MSEELPPSPNNGEPEPPAETENPPVIGDEGVVLPPRADRDRFGTLAKNVANPDRTCLTCAVLVLGAILLLIACFVYYYHANAAFHQP